MRWSLQNLLRLHLELLRLHLLLNLLGAHLLLNRPCHFFILVQVVMKDLVLADSLHLAENGTLILDFLLLMRLIS